MNRPQEWSRGAGRTGVTFSVFYPGGDLVVGIYNQNAHVGAVAVAEYDDTSRRTSTSLITRRGHKDDVVAQRVAYRLTKGTRKPCCVIAGIHVDDITGAEIEEILANVDKWLEEFMKREHNDG